jgi:AcrR family transcriptional regulator
LKPEKRQQIMQAAEALFSRCRFHEITMDEVAHEAGVGKGTIYRYFADKEELYFEVAVSGHEALCELVEAEASRDICFREKLVRVCEAVSDFFLDRHRVWHLMQSEERRLLMQRGGRHELWWQRRERLRDALAGVLQAGVASCELRADVPVPLLVACLRGMLRARAHEHRLEEGAELPPTSLIVDLFLNGAGAGPAEAAE